MGLFEKRRFRKFLIYVQNLDESNPSTWENIDLTKERIDKVYAKFGLEKTTIDFVGHSLALWLDDKWAPTYVYSNTLTHSTTCFSCSPSSTHSYITSFTYTATLKASVLALSTVTTYEYVCSQLHQQPASHRDRSPHPPLQFVASTIRYSFCSLQPARLRSSASSTAARNEKPSRAVASLAAWHDAMQLLYVAW